MQFVPRRMRVPLITLSAAAVCLWGVAIAGASELDDSVTAVAAAAAATVTVVTASTWIMLGVAFKVRDRDKELLINGIIGNGIVEEARKRVADGLPGHLRRIQ